MTPSPKKDLLPRSTFKNLKFTLISIFPFSSSHKFAVWTWNMWNPCDAAAIIFFLFGLSLRLKPSSRPAGRVIFCVDIIYWYLRILNILGVNKYLGEFVPLALLYLHL